MKHFWLPLIACLLTGWLGHGVHGATPVAPKNALDSTAQPELWFYAPTNFQVNERVDALIDLMRRAKGLGYSAMVTSDYKWGDFTDRPAHYFENLQRVKTAADRLGMEIIPAVCNIGYSNSLLMNDPNLAAALPVRDCLMTVRDGQATVANPENLLPFGDAENWKGNSPQGWSWVDGAGVSLFRDEQIKHSGKASIRMTDFAKGNEVGNARINRKLAVKPFHQYHFSAWIRTRDVKPAGDIRFVVLGKAGKSLNFTDAGVKTTQDWTQHHIVFNTLDNEEVNVYLGIWAGKGGTMWIDDVALTRVAGVNLLRREGCPLRVTSEDGKTVYEEGRDFDRWEHDKLGRVPWAGSYEVYHSLPAFKLALGSRIGQGQTIKVSYYHTTVIHGDQVCCSLLHEDVFKYVEREAREINKYFQPRRWMMNHDEIRVAGWDELYKDNQTVGEALAANVQRCADILKKVSPKATIYAWSDMFDPHHNAHADYYLCRTTLAESWRGLDKSVGIVNWNFGARDKSLAFFNQRGHGQVIAGYYDDSQVEERVKEWRAACRGKATVQAVMYATWVGNYDDLERFAKAVRGESWK